MPSASELYWPARTVPAERYRVLVAARWSSWDPSRSTMSSMAALARSSSSAADARMHTSPFWITMRHLVPRSWLPNAASDESDSPYAISTSRSRALETPAVDTLPTQSRPTSSCATASAASNR